MKRGLLPSLGASLVYGILSLLPASAQSLSVYLSAPDTQSTFLTAAQGALTANFDSLGIGKDTSVYVSPIGTYQLSATSPLAVVAADQFGGANGTHYVALGSQSGTSAPVTINLNGNYNYFGFWFSAGDANNGVSFYNGNTLVARFSTATIQAVLTPTTGHVTSLNGTVYNNSQYYGNPNNNMDTGETFSYINIVANGTTFNKIVLDNSGTTGTGFESDNHTVYAGTVTLPGTAVFAGTIVPEPSEYAAMMLGLVLCLVAGKRGVARFNFRRALSDT